MPGNAAHCDLQSGAHNSCTKIGSLNGSRGAIVVVSRDFAIAGDGLVAKVIDARPEPRLVGTPVLSEQLLRRD